VTFDAGRTGRLTELWGMTTDTLTTHRQLVVDFITDIWNERRFDRLEHYLHPAFTDHSLPPGFSPDARGTGQWIRLTGQSFEHRTVIDEQVTEPGKSILKVRMELRHIGEWRGIAPSGLEIQAVGYRCFRLEEGRIIGHWALIDGNAIENQLRGTAQGCKAL
jgi:predicted SnoaL-like aldol condensation-catalyzing enzyme